jgi:transposase InsO family protein
LLVSSNPEGSNDHPSRDNRALAQGRLSLLLALDVAPAGRAPADRHGAAHVDPADECREPLWGAPRIHGELLKLGFEVAQSSVAKYMVKRRTPPSQGWRTFLRNHAPDIAAMDLFVVPTVGFDLLYAFVIVRLDRRDLVWINVTANPTAEWVARQITEAFPWNEAPRYLIRDRDRIYGSVVRRRLRAMGIRDKPTAPASPWQNGFVERLIGSIRRECVDHIIILGEAHLRRILRSYACYYNGIRTHRSLGKDAPISRPVQRAGSLKTFPILGGLHHHYLRV